MEDYESLQKKLDAEIKSRVKLDAKVEQMKQEIKLLQAALLGVVGAKQ